MALRIGFRRLAASCSALRRLQVVPVTFTAMALVACAQVPGPDATGLPVGPVVASSVAQVRVGAPPVAGSIGSAIAIEPGVLVTNRHVLTLLGHPVDAVELVRADRTPIRGTVLARSERMDLGVVCAPHGFLSPAPLALRRPRADEPVWAAGNTTLGAPTATGTVVAARAVLPGSGEGLVARIGALAGYSGGPMVDADGRVLGMTTAVWEPSAATLLTSLVGVDLEGIALGDRREVFALGIDRVAAEARSLVKAAQSAGRGC